MAPELTGSGETSTQVDSSHLARRVRERVWGLKWMYVINSQAVTRAHLRTYNQHRHSNKSDMRTSERGPAFRGGTTKANGYLIRSILGGLGIESYPRSPRDKY